MNNTVQGLVILKSLRLEGKATRQKQVQECRWYPPSVSFVKMNSVGACKGNPDIVGVGAIFKNHRGEILGDLTKNIGVSISIIEECSAVVAEAEMAIKKVWLKIWIEMDSTSVAHVFGRRQVPWELMTGWQGELHIMEHVVTWGEVNFAADFLANEEVNLDLGNEVCYVARPPLLHKVEDPHLCYFDSLECSQGFWSSSGGLPT